MQKIVDIANDGVVIVEVDGKQVYTGKDPLEYGLKHMTREDIESCEPLRQLLIEVYVQASVRDRLDDMDVSPTSMKLRALLFHHLERLFPEGSACLAEVQSRYQERLLQHTYAQSGARLDRTVR